MVTDNHKHEAPVGGAAVPAAVAVGGHEEKSVTEAAAGKLHATTAAHGEEHGSGGLPQLNTHDFAPQLVWLALTFGVLYWMMSRIALPRIAHAIEFRSERIADDLDHARQSEKKAKQAEREYEERLAEARAEAHEIARQKREELMAQVEVRKKEVESRLAMRMHEAGERIEKARAGAMREVKTIAASATGEIIDHLMGLKVDEKQLEAGIDELMKQGKA